MFKSLTEKNNRRNQLSIMAQYLNTNFMINTVENEYLINIEKGVVTSVQEGPFVMPSYNFKLTAPKDEWLKFLQPIPQPGSHDIIAMLRRKVLKFEGMFTFSADIFLNLYFILFNKSLNIRTPKTI